MRNTSYQWNAADYAKNSSGQFQWAQELIEKLHLRGDERVLDLGCGDGKVSAAIAERVPAGRVVGVDLSWPMVALGKAQFSARPNLAFAQMNASGLGFTGAFDVVFSNAALHWVRDHRPVLAGVARSLRRGGRLLFQMGGRGNAAWMIAAMDAVRERAKWRGWYENFAFPYGFYGPEEYVGLLGAAGLEPQRVELIPKDMQHAGRAGLAGWGRTTWLPYLERVPADQREDFLEEVLDHYLADHPADADGTVHVQMMRLEVEAVNVG